MSVSLEILEAMEASGCTAAQLMAVIRADRDAGARRRAERARVRVLCFNAIAAAFAIEGEPVPELPADAALRVVPATDRDSAPIAESPSAGALESRSGSLSLSLPLPAPRETGQKARARYALQHMPGLRPAARRIGAILVERCNLATGRCDPSIESLMADAGLAWGRSVRRAIAELVDAGLVARVVNGRGRRNAYRPEWAALAAAAATAEAALMRGPGLGNRDSLAAIGTIESGQRGQSSPPKPSRETYSFVGGGGEHRTREPDRRQRELPLVRALPGGKSGAASGARGDARGDPRYGAASARLWQALRTHYGGAGHLGDAVDRIAALGLEEPATVAEMARWGDGLRMIVDALVEDGRRLRKEAG